MVARQTLTPTLGAELKKLKTATEKTSTRPFGTKILGEDSALEIYDAAGTLAVRLSPNGSFFTGTIDVTADGSSIRAFNADGVQTLDLNGIQNTIVGRIMTGPMGTPHIVVNPAVGSANLGIWYTPDGGLPGLGNPVGTVAGIYMSGVPAIGTAAPLVIRGQSGGGVTLHNDLNMVNGSVTASTLGLRSTNGRLNFQSTLAARFQTDGGSGGYEYITASSANVHMDGEGLIRRSTSSGRYKTDIEVYTPDPAWLDIPVNVWTDKAAAEAAALITEETPRPLTLEQQSALDRAATRYVGTVAEAAEAAAPLQIVYDRHGRPDAYAYDRDGAMLRHFVRGHRDALAAHERRLTALETAVQAREDQSPIE